MSVASPTCTGRPVAYTTCSPHSRSSLSTDSGHSPRTQILLIMLAPCYRAYLRDLLPRKPAPRVRGRAGVGESVGSTAFRLASFCSHLFNHRGDLRAKGAGR